MPYRIPGEIDEAGEVLADDVLDPSDAASLTLDIARTNPRGYAARFVLLSEDKQAAWLGRVSVISLKTHFTAMRTNELRMSLHVRDGEIVAEGFAFARAAVTFVKAASLATQTARIARTVGLPFVLDVDAVLSAIWTRGTRARRHTIPDLEAHALRMRVEAPYAERGGMATGAVRVELEWSSAALGGARNWATLVSEHTEGASGHDAHVERAMRRTKALATAFDVGLSVV
jgi:hypothetical protein